MKAKFSKENLLKLVKKPVFILASVLAIAIIAIIVAYGLNVGLSVSSKAVIDRIPALEKLNDGGKFAEAEKMANEILNSNPAKDTKIDALWELALAESAQGKFDLAIEDAKVLQKLDSASGHYILGHVYCNAKQYALAKQELTQAAKEDSSYKAEVDNLITQIEQIAK